MDGPYAAGAVERGPMGTLHLHLRSSVEALTISAYAQDLDARRYRCPPTIDRRLDRLLAADAPVRVLELTGPAGIGKSAALREAARRAQQQGYRVVLVDGRDAGAVAAFDEAGGRSLVVVDEAERLGAALRGIGARIAELAAESRVVVAARALPRRWLPDHVAELGERCRMSPLNREDADAVLIAHGVADPCARADVLAWAGGLPLALVLGARAPTAPPREVGDDLIEWIAGSELDDVDADLISVTALAGSVDAGLVAALLPDRDAAAEVARLRRCSFVEQAGSRLRLHSHLAAVVAEKLRTAEPARASALTLRLAAHEHDRAVAGDVEALGRLARLVADPSIRAALGPTVGAAYFADRVRQYDDAVLRDGLESVCPGLWSLARPWLCDPRARVVRRADGTPVAAVVAMPLAEAGRAEAAARLTAPVVEHATVSGLGDRAVLTALQVTFADAGEPEVAAIRNAAAMAWCGVANPRVDLVNLVGDPAGERDALVAYGYDEVRGLARTVAGVPVTTWLADVGDGGLAGLLYSVVATEQGASGTEAGGAVLLRALEEFHDDVALAALPVAVRDLPAAAAAEHVRAWVRTTLAARLAGEPVLLDQVLRRYVDASASHESVMRDTYASRATYFRRLRRARELIAGEPAQRTPQE